MIEQAPSAAVAALYLAVAFGALASFFTSHYRVYGVLAGSCARRWPLLGLRWSATRAKRSRLMLLPLRKRQAAALLPATPHLPHTLHHPPPQSAAWRMRCARRRRTPATLKRGGRSQARASASRSAPTPPC